MNPNASHSCKIIYIHLKSTWAGVADDHLNIKITWELCYIVPSNRVRTKNNYFSNLNIIKEDTFPKLAF